MIRTYFCKACGKFDHECRITEDVLRICPTCKESIQRVFSVTPVIWKTDGAFGKSNTNNK